jgi:hypothetical protein
MKTRKEYMISNKDKIRKRDLPGDLVSLGWTTASSWAMAASTTAPNWILDAST